MFAENDSLLVEKNMTLGWFEPQKTLSFAAAPHAEGALQQKVTLSREVTAESRNGSLVHAVVDALEHYKHAIEGLLELGTTSLFVAVL